MTFDPITTVNLVLCVIILCFGVVGFRRSRSLEALLAGLAFGLFGISHLFTILGLKASFTVFLIVIRTIAYLLVVYAVYDIAFRRRRT